ncbi:MAG: ABC transporter substrate-binding protein [Promethearchaeota archaeon]
MTFYELRLVKTINSRIYKVFSLILFIIILLLPYPITFLRLGVKSHGKTVEIETQTKENLQINTRRTLNGLEVITIGCWNYLNESVNYDPIRSAIRDVSFNQWRRHSLIFDTLVEYDSETKEIIPSLASQWVVSNDSTYWVFTLRNDVYFHDGTKFNASSVVFSFGRHWDPSNPTYMPGGSEDERGTIEIKSEYELIFRFKKPFASFIYNHAATHYIISETSFDYATLMTPIGTGPYKLDLSSSNSSFQSLTRNLHYFKGIPPFKKIYYRIYDRFDELATAIITRQVDFIPAYYNIEEMVQNQSYWMITTSNKTNTVLFGWINQNNTQLADWRVRTALNYAINRNALITLRKGYATASQSVLPPSSPFYDTETTGYPYNIANTTSLLDEAGYIVQRDGYRFHLNLGGINAMGGRLNQIKADFETIGVETDIILFTNLAEGWSKWINGEIDIQILGASYALNPQVEYQLLHSTGSQNFGKYQNEEVDKLLALGEETPVIQEREYYYAALQKLIQRDAPYLLLINLDTFYVTTTQIDPYIGYFNERFVLNYDPQIIIRNKLSFASDNQIILDYYKMKNVEISNKAIYFPFTDAVVVPTSSLVLKMNMSMCHNLSTFLTGQNEIGKFLQISSDQENTDYRLRWYYNLWEVKSESQSQLGIWQYREESERWEKLDTIKQNSTLQYVEVKVEGGKALLRFDADQIIQLSYKLVPFFLVALGGLVSFAMVTIIYNIKKIKEVRKMCGL